MKERLPLVVLTHWFKPEVTRPLLAGRARAVLCRDPSALSRALSQADALLTLVTQPVTEEHLAAAPRLRVVGCFGVGYDNVDLAACKRRGIRIVNTPGVLTRATAELALALLLAAARRIPEGERMCRAGKFRGWAPDMLLGLELRGRTAVLVGRGRIGTQTAELFRGIGLTVEWITRRDSAAQIRAKLARAQVLSLHLPMSPRNRHWLNRARLALLPGDAIVINTARGPIVDEAALIDALKTRRIFAAGLDVYEREPAIPKPLRRLHNVVLLPHLGSATEQARTGMAQLAVTGVLEVLGGKHPWNTVKF